MIGWLPPIATGGAFWLALWLFERRSDEGVAQFAASLVAGAIAAHLGWLFLFQRAPLSTAPLGSSVLFLPLGPLVFCRRPSAFASLPLPLALARVGCLATGCCHGTAGEPLPLFELLWLGGLHLALRATPGDARLGAFLLGFGALRLVEEPLRPSPDGAIVAPFEVALCWAGLGAIWLARSATSR